jgi:hypothetical protein
MNTIISGNQDKTSLYPVPSLPTGISPGIVGTTNTASVIHTEVFKATAYNSSCTDPKPMTNDIATLPASAPSENWKDVGIVTDVMYRKRGVEGQLLAPRGDVQSMHFTRFKRDMMPVLQDMRYNDYDRTLKQFDYQTQPECTRLKIVMTRTATACDTGKCKKMAAKEFTQNGPLPYSVALQSDSGISPYAHLPDGMPRYEATPYVTGGMDTGGAATTSVNTLKGGHSGIFPVPDFMKYSGEQKEAPASASSRQPLVNTAPSFAPTNTTTK